jgi:hypothetical protein
MIVQEPRDKNKQILNQLALNTWKGITNSNFGIHDAPWSLSVKIGSPLLI